MFKRYFWILALCAILPVGLSAESRLKRLVKIAYVDVERVIASYPGSQDIRAKLKEEKNKYEAEITKQKDEVARLEQDYQNNFDRLTDDEKKRREAEIEYKKDAVTEFIDDANKKLEALKIKLTNPIYLKVLAVIRKVSSTEGYSFVFRKSSKVLLYHDQEFDITNDVIRILSRELHIQERN